MVEQHLLAKITDVVLQYFKEEQAKSETLSALLEIGLVKRKVTCMERNSKDIQTVYRTISV